MARFCDSNQKRGLTLVELIVVLVILAVLAALLVPSLTGYIDKAVEKRVMLQARSLMTAAQATIVFSASSTFFSCFVISNTSISPYSLLAQLLNSEFT